MREAAIALLVAASLSAGHEARPALAAPPVQFAGSTPCDPAPRRFLAIPETSNCERITWELTLSGAGTGTASTYQLRGTYGMQGVNVPGFASGARTVELAGAWSIVAGRASDPKATVYRLVTGSKTADFVLLGGRLLHLLDANRRLMIGNAGWSYTLNRLPDAAGAMLPQTKQTIPDGNGKLDGLFEGRTPCREITAQLELATGPECAKLKWGLTLTMDWSHIPKSPPAYKLEGTLYRNQVRTGKWSAGLQAGARALVYTLDPVAGGGGYLSLVRVDDVLLFLEPSGDFLVGNIRHSYTLNRVSDVTAR